MISGPRKKDKWEGFPWPPPADKEALGRWNAGVLFALRGGPHDGLVLRLFPHPYPDSNVSGWDEVIVEGCRYVRPHDSDPYMKKPAKVNKGRTNVPRMEFTEAGVVAANDLAA